MLNQDPQKKISGITNRPRPISPESINQQSDSWMNNSDPLGKNSQGIQVPPTSQQGTTPPLAPGTPPEQKKGFKAAMKDKLAGLAKKKLKERISGTAPDASPQPGRQVPSEATPDAPAAPPTKMGPQPNAAPPSVKLPSAPQRPQMPKLPKLPKMR